MSADSAILEARARRRAARGALRMGAALAGVILAGSGCGRSDREDAGGASGRPRPGAIAEAAGDSLPEPRTAPGELSILSWSDTFVPALLDEFSENHGATLSLTEVDNSEQLIQALESEPGRYDLIVVDDKSIPRLIDLRLLGELDLSRLPGLTHLSARFRALPFDPGNRYSVPYLWGTTTLAYRKDRLDPGELSWNLLWEERLKGRIAILDEPEDMYFITLLASGCDPLRANASQVDAATARLTDSFTRQGGRMLDYATALDALESGEVDLVVNYSGDAGVRARENPNIGVAIPGEGAPLWLDSFVLSRDTDASDLAHRFIDFMLKPEVAATTANALQYGSPNASAIPLVDEELLKDRSLYPDPATLARCRFISFEPECQDLVSEGVRRLFETIRQQGIHPERGEALAVGGSGRTVGGEPPVSVPCEIEGTPVRQGAP